VIQKLILANHKKIQTNPKKLDTIATNRKKILANQALIVR
jgi:hypothetical protein